MINPRDLEKLMKSMKMEAVEADEVLIKSKQKTIIVRNPQVVKSDVMGKTSFQVTGDVVEENNDSDIDIIAQKTGASKEEAKLALQETGDIASAILKLTSG
ncbi:MAG: nascent polypeptide-associated complex protein [Candidatus Aenigmarchaeota archaeon]|nr:nascent polypeptide-associated complex protein [Candidatus Aenigmarchaeota archaeon]